MMDYTHQQSAGYRVRSPWASRVAIVNISRIAEDEYRRQYGARSKFVHVQARFIERQSDDWAISPNRWPYYERFPNNITVFATIDETGFVTLDGWLRHDSVLASATPGGECGTFMIAGPLNPMASFWPEAAR